MLNESLLPLEPLRPSLDGVSGRRAAEPVGWRGNQFDAGFVSSPGKGVAAEARVRRVDARAPFDGWSSLRGSCRCRGRLWLSHEATIGMMRLSAAATLAMTEW